MSSKHIFQMSGMQLKTTDEFALYSQIRNKFPDEKENDNFEDQVQRCKREG